IDRYKTKGLGPKEILNNVISHIYGFDINPFACHIAEMNLLFQVIDLYQKAKEEDKEYRLPRFNIYETDSLEIPKVAEDLTRWQYSTVQRYMEDKDNIDRIKNRKFDFVVGNPPYVRIERLPKELKDYLIQNYKPVCVGRFDLYIPFMFRGISWLDDGGLFGAITSNKFIQRQTGSGIRRVIVENCEIQHFLDFGDSGVFEDVTNYPLISILVRRKSIDERHQLKYVEVFKPKEDLLNEVRELMAKNKYSDDYLRLFKVRQSCLRDSWQFMPENERIVYERIRTAAKQTLEDLCEDVRRGIVTGENDAFIVDSEAIVKNSLEKELLKPILRGDDVTRWKIFWKGTYLIYPYTEKDGKNELVDLSEYPHTKRYLEEKREYLEKRYSVSELGKAWYGIHDPIDFHTFERGFKTIYLKQFPIKLPESPQEKKLADEVIDLVGQILDLIKLQQDSERDLSSRTERTDNARLDDYPSIIFNISSNKIVQIRREGSRVLLNLTDYIECKDDFVARYVELCLKFSEAKLTYSNDLRRDIGQVRIPKDKQLVHRLVKRHDEEQKEIEGIPERVKNLERDIDQRVYTLYKLSKDDIDLIEETIA